MSDTTTRPTWIRGPKLRKRWDMPASTFYDLLSRGRIPKPEYPFGPSTPYWRLDAVEAHEQQAQRAAA